MPDTKDGRINSQKSVLAQKLSRYHPMLKLADSEKINRKAKRKIQEFISTLLKLSLNSC